MTQPTIKIGLWMHRGLTRGSEELRLFLSVHNIDVMLVTESHMREGQRIFLPGYSTYHVFHPSGNSRGGASVIVRSSISHSPQPPISTNDRQIAYIQLQTAEGPVVLAAVYLPPRERWIRAEFESLFAVLGNKFIAGGDYNAKHAWWGNSRACARGKVLQEVVANGQYQILATGEPTFYSYNPLVSPSALDFFVVNGYDMRRLNVQTLHELSSDHTPLLADLHAMPINKPPRSCLLARGADIERFKAYLTQHIDLSVGIQGTDDIDNAIDSFMDILKRAAIRSAPSHQQNVESSRQLQLPPIVASLIRLKRKVRREYARTGDARIQQIHSRLANRLHKVLNRRKQSQIDNLLENLDTDGSTNFSLWRITKRYKTQATPNSAIRNPAGGWCRTSREKTEVFANHLEQRFKALAFAPESHSLMVAESLQTPFQMALPADPVTLEEVKELVSKLKPKKAPGEDLLDNRTIRLLPDQALLYLVLIFNSILRVGYFPKARPTASIIMILKPGKQPLDVDSYRPTSLLPSLGKMLERLILNRILTSEEVTRAIPKFQFGFRLQHGTPEQLHRVVNFALEALEKKEYAGSCFLDIQQAFDRVWHPGLLYKAKSLLSPQLFQLIKSFWEGRKFSVTADGCRSSVKFIEAGVPQGSVLGPTLYSIFTADMPNQNAVTGLAEGEVLIATYADDIAVLTKSTCIVEATDALQEYLDAFQEWAVKWNVSINAGKCANVTFTNAIRDCPGVTINGSLLSHTHEYKYLGVILDRSLTFRRHITSLQHSFRTRITKMNWLLAARNKLSLDNKVKIYKCIVAPGLFYAIQVYGIAARTHLNKIRVLQAKMLRKISGAPWYMRTRDIECDLKVPKIGDKIREVAKKYHERLDSHPNSLARRLGVAAQRSASPRSRVRRRLKRHHPQDLLDRALT
uniref:RNA-directed DNA polymerase from mobile element jockey n=1 Tax=Drosophila funebris TaxID=7221 RepID=RTJK_DROFU|nr:RecName: Full=RNA-directed DNA polymerase from mobile element jockey; AltName: Full=Reverse transcriptase [Drosophila funebris]AAA28649.1 ORF2; putative [Drosophila funebris]